MDPEDLREVISAYQKRVGKTVQRFGGVVAKYMGDGVLVYFGYPHAHEDDAERAVRAGLELIQTVGAMKSSPPLQTRVGIATGLVVIGDLIGSGEAQERGIVGETPNLAARLQGIAEPNTVVIAESTRKLLGNLFELHDLGAKELKGIAEPMRAWAALRASAVESRFEALRTATTPLVGRGEEMALLVRRWEQAKAGEGQIVLVSGEQGIGKSRLAQTMVERLAGEPHIRLRFFCSPHHQDSALYPVIAHLERAAGFRRDDTDEQRFDKLEALLARATNNVHEVAPFLADLLSLPTDGRYPPLDLAPPKRKERTLAALSAQVEGLAARQPLLMVYEDIHWSDPTTRESLDLLVDRLPKRRILAMITLRPEFSPPWIGRPNVTLLTLNRLSPRQRADMISGVTGGKTLPKEITDQIIERTDGVPLFIEELTKSVVESGLVTETGDHYSVTGPTAPLAIPTTLQASLLARLDRLAPTREVAQIGAALGRTFSHEVISAVAQIPRQKLDDALEQLVGAELIFRRGTPPDAEYTFKHALVRDTAYSTLLRSRRQQIHARVASTLENQFPEVVAAQPGLLAHHCTEAGLHDRAVEYLLKAGQQAVARSAMVEAVSQLEKGLALLTTMPSSRGHQQQELDLRVALGPALIATRGYSSPEVGETFARASALAEQIGQPSYVLPLLYGQFGYHLVRSEHRHALLFAERLEHIGEARNESAALLLGRLYHGIVRVFLGEFLAARALFEQCHDLRDPSLRQSLSKVIAEDGYATLLAYLGITCASLGYFDQAISWADEGLSEARRLQHVHTLASCLLFKCWVSVLTNRIYEIEKPADELLALANEHGFSFWTGWALFYRGLWAATFGRESEGVSSMSQAQALTRVTGAVISSPFLLTHLAMALDKLGQPAEALSKLREATEFIGKTEERYYEAEVHRFEGELLSSKGNKVAAAQSFSRALAVAERQNARAMQLRVATSLARLWRDQGKRVEARELLAPVYGWFTEGFDTLDLKEAKALLDELAS
jgi:class 3 adenylate cyclase/predicted ATPase